MNRHSFALFSPLVVLGAFWAGLAVVRADGGAPEPQPEPSSAPMIEVLDPAAAGRMAVVVAPDALQNAAMAAHRAGDDMWLAVNFVVGNPSGLRVEAFPFSSRNLKVGIEAIAGEQTGSFAAGAGVRLQIRLAGGPRNGLYVSPGVDVYLSPPTTTGMGHYESIYYVATDVDVSWLHEFAHHFGVEVGIKAGGEVMLDAPSWVSTTHTAILPELGIFAGVRF